MAIGKRQLSTAQKDHLAEVIDAAEASTGIQFIVCIGRSRRDPSETARALLAAKGYKSEPGVSIIVAPNRRRVEIATSSRAKTRITDDACERAVSIMLPALSHRDWVSALELGVRSLAEEAGPGLPDADGELLPNVVET